MENEQFSAHFESNIILIPKKTKTIQEQTSILDFINNKKQKPYDIFNCRREYNMAIKRYKLVFRSTIWMTLKGIILNKRSQSQLHLYNILKKKKLKL